ncbi:hypothetical protein GYMLUDRAFT_50832 [Collybiopsis luxurians FD-317 M1]|uniref:Unplaced genomic scaffold GYMLUscaffold_127, whole genome shotgun sequence n=1 Tax=Collybiopsis luxurians FD-317 M1 TaxID=944289 RepID=A0A0D0BNG7_9AGAR|nr:hypothetical protein GYMLUDRAFT_50832 [Collybiopsis luxurians FD-317 M1]
MAEAGAAAENAHLDCSLWIDGSKRKKMGDANRNNVSGGGHGATRSHSKARLERSFLGWLWSSMSDSEEEEEEEEDRYVYGGYEYAYHSGVSSAIRPWS